MTGVHLPQPPATGTPTTHVADTTPYPWPWDGRLRPESLALVLCGWSTGWRSVTDDAGAERRIHTLVDAVTAAGGLVVAVAPGNPRHVGGVPPGEPLPLAAGQVLPAGGLDGFHASWLDPHLRRAGRTHLLLAGYGLEGPVHSTLRSANDRGLECLLVTDACAPGDTELVAASISSVEMSGGIFGAVGHTAAVVAALHHPSRAHPSPRSTS